MNPFKYGQVVTQNDFCPRPKLNKELLTLIDDNQRIVVQGERRVGKTSLIMEALIQRKKRKGIYVDLLEIKTPDDLCKRMIKSILYAEQQDGMVEKILKSLSGFKPSVSIDPLTGQPSFSLDKNLILHPDSIEGIFDLMETLNKKRPLIVVLDEFQDILNLKEQKETLAILRGKIQFLKETCFIFSGSINNKMHEIFNLPDSAFFKSCIPLVVGPMEFSDYSPFLKDKFMSGKRKVNDDVLKWIFELSENNSGDVQQLCGAIWETTSYNSEITKTNIPNALNLIYSREIKGYETILGQISNYQLKCLLALSRVGGKSVQSIDFIKEVGITNVSSIKKAFVRLEEIKIIYLKEKEYKFVNPFFKSWLLSKNLLFE